MLREAEGVKVPTTEEAHQRERGNDRGGAGHHDESHGHGGSGRGSSEPEICNRCRGLSLFTKEMKDRSGVTALVLCPL